MNTVIGFIDRYLNHTTMYRLVLYYCTALLAGDFILGLRPGRSKPQLSSFVRNGHAAGERPSSAAKAGL